jgi:hypothetical protein
MRIIFSIAALLICVGIVGLLAKKQTESTVQLPSGSTGESKAVRTPDLPKQIQSELNNAAQEAAKRLEQVEPKQEAGAY